MPPHKGHDDPYGMIIEIGRLTERLSGLEKIVNLHVTAMDKNVILAKEEMERRILPINEQLANQAKRFITDEAVRLLVLPIAGDVAQLKKGSNISTGEKKWSDHLITVIIGAIVILIAWFIKGM